MALAACGDDEPTAPEPGTGGGQVVVLLPNSSSTERWERDDRRFLAQALTAQEIDHSVVNAEGDAVQMQIQAEQAIAGGAEVLIMAHLDPASGSTIIENARLNEVAVIDYERLTGGADFYVGADPEAVGRALGRGLAEAVSEAGLFAPDVAVVAGPSASRGEPSLASGYGPVLSDRVASDSWTITDVPAADRSAARSAFTALPDAGAGIDAVIATDDDLADAVIELRDERGAAPIPLVSRGATITGLQNILTGEQSLSLYTSIPDQAQAAVDLAAAIVGDEPTMALAPQTIGAGPDAIPALLLAPTPVTAENIAETVIADGLRTWAEICVEAVEPFCPPADER